MNLFLLLMLRGKKANAFAKHEAHKILLNDELHSGSNLYSSVTISQCRATFLDNVSETEWMLCVFIQRRT